MYMFRVMSRISSSTAGRLTDVARLNLWRPLWGNFYPKRIISGDSSAQQGTDRSPLSETEGSSVSDSASEAPLSERQAGDMSGPRAPESAILIAARRRRAIAEAGGYTHVIVREERFTDVSAPRKRRERISRPWVGAYKPVLLRKNTIMPARETTIAPKPKIVLSPQWPLVYRQKMYLDAEVAFDDPDEYDPENPPPHMLQTKFFPRYMRFISVFTHFMVAVSVIYVMFFLDYGVRTHADVVRSYVRRKLMEYLILEPAEMKVLAKREAELRELNPPRVNVVAKARRELNVEQLKYQNSLSVQYSRPTKPPKLLEAKEKN